MCNRGGLYYPLAERYKFIEHETEQEDVVAAG